MNFQTRYLILFGLLGAQPALAQDKHNHFGKAMMSGAQVYQKVCVTCHGHGLAGAPQAGKKKVWAPLIAEGYDDLVGSALTGIRMMPPKGGAPELYDIEVARAVNHMVAMSGGSFPEPTDANVKAARAIGERQHRERLKKAAAARSLQQ
ncbi:MAG: c-type cytochrome [Fluviibacter sp.]|jgi:cytochrome c5